MGSMTFLQGLNAGAAVSDGVVTFIIFFVLAYLAAVYLLMALGLNGIARNEGLSKWWFAWIPGLNLLLIPMLVEDDVHEALQGRFTLIFIAVSVLGFAASLFLPRLGYASVVLTMYSFYYIADRYSDRPGLHMIACILTGTGSLSVSLFMFRNRESLYE